MAAEIFDRLVEESGPSAEHMMLIGLGEPFLDPRIFERIEYCARHGFSTLLSTNGTLLDEAMAERILSGALESITLSFDGATKESFEFYRKGARFEKVRDNFVRFCRMKKERGARVEVVVQMVRMERNAGRGGGVHAVLAGGAGRRPGPDQGGRDQPDAPQAGHAAADWKYPCHYLWRGPMYVKQNGDVYPCCQSYMLTGNRWGVSPPLSQSTRYGIRGRCSACGGCTPRGGRGRSRSVRVAAPRFRTRCWWWGAWPCTAARCGGCCRRLSGLLI